MNNNNSSICTPLTEKSKSGVTCMSFLSHKDEEDQLQCLNNLSVCIDSEKRIHTSHLTNNSSSTCIESRSDLNESYTVKPSNTVEGKLVVRVLPVQYGDYDTQKSMAKIDPASLIRNLSAWESTAKNVNSTTSFIGEMTELQKVEVAPSTNDGSSIIGLDLYLLRSDYLNDPKNYEERIINRKQARERLTQTLINSVDLSRNNSRHAGFENTKSYSPSLFDAIFHLHMNRKSNESAARTLRRLEISTTRKLKGICKTSGKKDSDTCKNRPSYCKVVSVASINKEEIADAFSNEEEVNLEEYSDNIASCGIDISKRSSTELWHECSSKQDSFLKIVMTLPSAIVPWHRNTESTTVEWVGLDVVSNPPTILSIKTFENFMAHLFTGVPIVLQSTILYATHCRITWFADEEVVMYDSKAYTPTLKDVGKKISVLVIPIRNGHNGNGCQEAYSFSRLVESLPLLPIVELRQNWIRRISDVIPANGKYDSLRVLTYNILADIYAGREIDQTLMYSHCEALYLLRKRRVPLIVAEILAYKADIICLQEVDASVHNSFLYPILTACGYQGFYSNKVTAQQEGCSMFWSSATFELAADCDMMNFPLRELLTHEKCAANEDSNKRAHIAQYYDAKSDISEIEPAKWESMHGINNLLESHDEVRKIYKESVGQIVQMARLVPKEASFHDSFRKPDNIILANTHLFYHPMADHIRLLQVYAICHKLDEVRRAHHNTSPVLICGDFNSGPLSGAVRLLTHRSLSPNENDCWKHLNVYKWECGNSEYMLDHGYIGNPSHDLMNEEPLFLEEEFLDAYNDVPDEAYFSDDNEIDKVCLPTITLPTCFPDLISGCTTIPAFTNYAVDFVETLDYIFASEPSREEKFGFRPLGHAPMPSEEMVKNLVAMPNKLMPSDHVAIVCDFEWAVNPKTCS